jgi:hypothetical protein
MLIDDIKKAVKCDETKLRKFGFTMGGIFAALGFIIFFRKTHFSYALFFTFALIFISAGAGYPKILAPVYKIWMAFATCLGWVMTRLILTVLFFIVVTPIGILARVSGKDFLNLKFDDCAGSYWIKRAAAEDGRKNYEKQF